MPPEADEPQTNDQPMQVVLCWHMHQPCYKVTRTGEYDLPWVYLHATKDYTDMAAILEATPGARVVVNFCPILLEQIEDYAAQIKTFLLGGDGDTTGAGDRRPLSDPLLRWLAAEELPASSALRHEIVHDCLRANERRLIRPYAAYSALVEQAGWLHEHDFPAGYLQDQYYFDLLTWYHLAWLGETVRRSDRRVIGLLRKETQYSLQDRRMLLGIIGELLSNVIPRYRALADQGKVELSVTPYSHPMLPLLLDMEAARESQHDLPLPARSYVDGAARVDWQLRKATQVFREYFGREPAGCWPSEGGLSDATLEALDEHGFKWTASGGKVLLNSMQEPPSDDRDCLHHGYLVGDRRISCFFREDHLSDLIGFTYSDWHGDDAAANMVARLQQIQRSPCEHGRQRLVCIILDGENCWEYYPHNGYYFLTALYKGLIEDENLVMTTFSEYLAATDRAEHSRLDSLIAGSWVDGTFATWVGDGDKNRAWDLLCDAAEAVYQYRTSEAVSEEKLRAVEKQLAICEGSDWSWWPGDYNPAAAISEFESLFRLHLRNLYEMLDLAIPDELDQPVSRSMGQQGPVEGGGVMRRSSQDA